jgi:transposase-like protein
VLQALIDAEATEVIGAERYVVGVFPNDAAIDRLVTAVVVEQHDEWAVAERRNLSETSMARLRQSEPDVPTPTRARKRLAG